MWLKSARFKLNVEVKSCLKVWSSTCQQEWHHFDCPKMLIWPVMA